MQIRSYTMHRVRHSSVTAVTCICFTPNNVYNTQTAESAAIFCGGLLFSYLTPKTITPVDPLRFCADSLRFIVKISDKIPVFTPIILFDKDVQI